jgi:uncharacterized protein (DUF952 family)
VSEFILHATSQAAWTAARAGGLYFADSSADEGFIHCSKADQILRVADSFFRGQHDLVLMVIDPGRLTSKLRWELGTDLATELFPHIYGPINLEAVLEVFNFEPAADGKFHLPACLELAGR